MLIPHWRKVLLSSCLFTALTALGTGLARVVAKSAMEALAGFNTPSFNGVVQISDSHMGFNKPANPDVISTLRAAVDKINALPQQPECLLHTGDISHLSKPEEFDNKRLLCSS
jgi:hypothetical protein